MSYVDEVLERVIAKNPERKQILPGGERSFGIFACGNRKE